MSLRKRSLLSLLLVFGLAAASLVAIFMKPTVLGLDLQGGAEVILQASDTADAQVNSDTLNRAVNVINNRVNRLGVAEPEIQVQGGDKIRVALPGIEDTAVIDDLVKSAQLQIYPFQQTLVGYERFPGQGIPVGTNPTQDLYQLIQMAKAQPPPQARDGAQPSFFLFRAGTPRQLVAGVDGGPYPTREALLRRLSIQDEAVAAEYEKNPKLFDLQQLPAGYVILTDASTGDVSYEEATLCGEPGGQCVLLLDQPGASGADISGANMVLDQLNRPAVGLQFTGNGQKNFAALTKRLVQDAQAEARPSTDDGRFYNFAISLDGVIISRPYVSYIDNPNGIDSDRAEISGGGFSEDSAKMLADQISSGSIPIRLDTASASTVGASLGEDSLRQGLIAGLIGVLLVILGLIVYYRVLGIIAAGIIVVYGVYLWAIAKIIPVALTLPGIAGVILTVGMAADASVVIFERVREEVRQGKPAKAAVLSGYRRGINAIIDGNIVTLLTAIFIFLLSTSGPRGFALTLFVGGLMALFTAMIATPALLGVLVESRLFKNERLIGLHAPEPRWKFDVVGRWKFWIGISFIPLIIGLGWVFTQGFNQGIDFTGGTKQSITFTQQPPAEEIRNLVLSQGHPEAKVTTFNRTLAGEAVTGFDVETKTLTSQESDRFMAEIAQKYPGAERIELVSVGATFGRDVVKNALWAILFSFLAIIAYLTLRFELKLALPAMLTVVHVVWFALTVYSISGKEITAASVAAFLTILGYSLYDVVIVFDRIRENEPLMRGRPYRDVVNRSVHETFTRSLITMISTLLPILALYFFGGDTLEDFSFALLVGILTGGVSSIFIAAPLVGIWKEREPDQKRLAARAAKKAARASQVDADILDVGALARAEAAMQGAAPGPEPAALDPLLADPPTIDPVIEAGDEPAPAGDAPAPNDDAPATGDAPADTEARPTPPKPRPDRKRRHQNVQRKRRR